MVLYYRLDKQEVVDTRTEIPQEQWEKKQVLPYSRVYSFTEEDAGIGIYEDCVVETFYKAPEPILTLQEYKLQVYEEIKFDGRNKILETFSLEQQMSAVAGFYSVEENESIKTYCKTAFDLIRSKKDLLMEATKKNQCDAIYQTFLGEL